MDATADTKQHPQPAPGLVQNRAGENPGGGIKRISALIASGDLKSATRIIKAHLVKYPDDADYLILLARVKQRSGKPDRAIELLRRARTYAKDYEDVYLLEANLLASKKDLESCHKLASLFEDYNQYTKRANLGRLENILLGKRYGNNEVHLATQYDELSNNRGVWHTYTILTKHTTCAGNSIYAGLNTVERYNIHDTEGIVGGGLQAGNISVELEYRQSQARDLLAKNSWSGVLNMDTGISVNLMLLASKNKYDQIETDSVGLGIDYYVSNFQITLIGEQTNYYRNGYRLDSSGIQRYYLGYYFATRKFVRMGYIAGKELDNDGSENPPYSKVRTVLLSSFFSVSFKAGFLVELKRHHQSGYYEQNSIRVAFDYKYQ